MTRLKYLKGECSHCKGHIEFPADAIGMTTECPHCGQTTELLLAAPPEHPAISKRTIVWTTIAVLICALGLVVVLVGLNFAKKRLVDRAQLQTPPPSATTSNTPPPPPPEDPATKAGFQATAITLEKETTPGSSLVYAVGTVTNPSAKRRFGVRVEIDILNAADQKVGTAKDYQQVIEPNSDWRFRALVVASKAATAKLASIKEDQ